MDPEKKSHINKVYCDHCDTVFDSQEEFKRHRDMQSGAIACESCPIDTVINKFIGIFKRKN